ncbi:MAG: galactokinase [Planctomycetes bacterium]|nr:galactokinase [Planctomycetota bacterium]
MNAAALARENAMARAVLEALPDAHWMARAPGRVNLIGEHTDYNGFPVLPLALDRAAWIAAAPRTEPIVRIRSVDAARWPEEEIALRDLASRVRRGSWVDYVVAGLRTAPPAHGLELVVGSDVPVAAGLSSSAALVVAALLLAQPARSRVELAELAARAEQYVGTHSGGMDQAISLLARAGHALRIDFRPLRTRAVALPPDLVVLVAPSGVLAEKGGAAQAAYNQRVAECARAAGSLGAPVGGLLADVPGERRAERAASLGEALLARRARFVFEEARRVDEAERCLARGDIEGLGALLDASHAGLRDLYEVSHPVVDALVAELRTCGARGARIVGAGFGGCAVAVARRSDVDAIRARCSRELWTFVPGGPAERFALER